MTKTPTHNTLRKKAQNGSEVRASLRAYPLYTIKLSFNYLFDASSKDSDLRTLMGFYNQVHGSFDNFLLLDKDDCTTYRQTFGVGDGSTTKFRLAKNYGGFMEPLYGIDKDTAILYTNGGQITGVTPYTDGYVIYNTAPQLGAILSWSGTHYYRCIFDDDSIDFDRMFSKLWSTGDIKLFTERGGST